MLGRIVVGFPVGFEILEKIDHLFRAWHRWPRTVARGGKRGGGIGEAGGTSDRETLIEARREGAAKAVASAGRVDRFDLMARKMESPARVDDERSVAAERDDDRLA